VLNLLMNAADAVSTASGADRHVRVTTAACDDRVIVSVSDRGEAIPDAQFAKLFEPFFTTKREGMGLGLSICRTIMEAHGGEISARRNPDRGLTCWFVLDVVKVSASPSPHVARRTVESHSA
jgi:signal transduction histidine kinase